MTTESVIEPGIRYSLHHLQDLYKKGQATNDPALMKPLSDVMRAWQGIKALPPEDPNSFFVLGGFHGEPFDLRPDVDALSATDRYAYWGGWCNHGNVLFPTWHRVYLHRLEKSLQTIVPGVMLPFWDETNSESLEHGVPWALTDLKFVLDDGTTIDNPLVSFVLPASVADDYWGDNNSSETHQYFKPAGYETVRYPLSGLVGNIFDREATLAHNALYPDPDTNLKLLNQNVTTWLRDAGLDGKGPQPNDPDPGGVGVYTMYQRCLTAPNYTVFSNTTSAGVWNLTKGTAEVPLEQPHNDVHLSVGGFGAPNLDGGSFPDGSGQVIGANGDMGENNTAGLDPIFFFHHCNVDRMFWLWQKQNGHTDKLEVIKGYPGTSSSDSQGPTPGIAPGSALDMDTPLNPFSNPMTNAAFTSNDCVNIKTQLGYDYGPGSFDAGPGPIAPSPKVLTVRGIDRALFQGSFILTAYAEVDGKVIYLGHHSVLSRWSVIQCANCRTHLEVVTHFPLSRLTDEQIAKATFTVKVAHRGTAVPTKLNIVTSVSG